MTCRGKGEDEGRRYEGMREWQKKWPGGITVLGLKHSNKLKAELQQM